MHKEIKADVHKCSRLGCGKSAELQCPTCLKLGLPPGYFCSQACFKAEWSTHKALHTPRKSQSRTVAGPLDFPGFKFTVAVAKSL